MNIKTVYFDMDGVLAKFEQEPRALERFQVEKGFFKNLEPMGKNIMVMRELIAKGVQVKILSATPNNQADRDKFDWLMKYIPELKTSDIIFCRLGEDKAKYVTNIENSLLIDDYTMNLIKWRNKGGKVLKFINAYDNEVGTHTKEGIIGTNNLNLVKLMLGLN